MAQIGTPGGGGGGGGGGGASEEGGGSFAEKMMRKMGWQEGKGLGAQSQGITTALQAHKTGNKTGRIVNNELGQLGAPSRCVLLTNMVGAGEADKQLEEETKLECSKYGFISRCVIHELAPGAPEDQAVRIFLLFDKQVLFFLPLPPLLPPPPSPPFSPQSPLSTSPPSLYPLPLLILFLPLSLPSIPPTPFPLHPRSCSCSCSCSCSLRTSLLFLPPTLLLPLTLPNASPFLSSSCSPCRGLTKEQESAMKAVMDLDGRFFGGRQVRASFFGEDDFANNKLDPKETDDEI
eukprot:764546-Hanusia_phi.AAC.3